MLCRVEHVLQVADLVIELRGRVLRIQVPLTACVTKDLLVHHDVCEDPSAVVARCLVARHVVLVVTRYAPSNLSNQQIPQTGQKFQWTCCAVRGDTIL